MGQRPGCQEWLHLIPFIHTQPPLPPPRPSPAQPPKCLPLGRLSQLGWTSPCTWSHGCRSAPQRGRDQENHSAWGHGGAPKLHHRSPSEWGPPPRPVKSPHGSLLHSSLATGHCKQPSSALPTNGQEVLAGIINRPSPCLCPRHLGSSEVVPIHGGFFDTLQIKLQRGMRVGLWAFSEVPNAEGEGGAFRAQGVCPGISGGLLDGRRMCLGLRPQI